MNSTFYNSSQKNPKCLRLAYSQFADHLSMNCSCNIRNHLPKVYTSIVQKDRKWLARLTDNNSNCLRNSNNNSIQRYMMIGSCRYNHHMKYYSYSYLTSSPNIDRTNMRLDRYFADKLLSPYQRSYNRSHYNFPDHSYRTHHFRHENGIPLDNCYPCY